MQPFHSMFSLFTCMARSGTHVVGSCGALALHKHSAKLPDPHAHPITPLMHAVVLSCRAAAVCSGRGRPGSLACRRLPAGGGVAQSGTTCAHGAWRGYASEFKQRAELRATPGGMGRCVAQRAGAEGAHAGIVRGSQCPWQIRAAPCSMRGGDVVLPLQSVTMP